MVVSGLKWTSRGSYLAPLSYALERIGDMTVHQTKARQDAERASRPLFSVHPHGCGEHVLTDALKRSAMVPALRNRFS